MQRVTGPDYMLKTIALGLSQGWRHYFYGSTPETLEKMEKALREKYPAIQIAGMYSPPFRALSAEGGWRHCGEDQRGRPGFCLGWPGGS